MYMFLYTKQSYLWYNTTYVHVIVHLYLKRSGDILARIDVKDFDEQVMVQLKMIAKERGIPFSELVREVLEKYVEDRILSSSITKFEVALRNTQISLDANTEAYNQFIEENKRFRGFFIDLLTKEELQLDEDNYDVSN